MISNSKKKQQADFKSEVGNMRSSFLCSHARFDLGSINFFRFNNGFLIPLTLILIWPGKAFLSIPHKEDQ